MSLSPGWSKRQLSKAKAQRKSVGVRRRDSLIAAMLDTLDMYLSTAGHIPRAYINGAAKFYRTQFEALQSREKPKRKAKP